MYSMSGILSAQTTINAILSARNKVMKIDYVNALNKRIRECKYPDLEKTLFIWFTTRER